MVPANGAVQCRRMGGVAETLSVLKQKVYREPQIAAAMLTLPELFAAPNYKKLFRGWQAEL
jgi:hypothetical protein